MSDANKVVLTAIVGIFVGLVLGRLMWYNRALLPDEPSMSDEATTTESMDTPTPEKKIEQEGVAKPVSVKEENSVSAENQPAGNTARVSVSVNQASWVEVRDNNNGVLGKVLGAKHVDAGTAIVTIGLQRATTRGGSYFVALTPYNNGSIDYSVGALIKDSSGQPISSSFVAE